MKLWQKDKDSLKEVEKFTVGRDPEMDSGRPPEAPNGAPLPRICAGVTAANLGAFGSRDRGGVLAPVANEIQPPKQQLRQFS